MAITFVGSGVGTHAATSAQTYNFSNLRDAANAAPTLAQGDIVYVAVENSSTVNRGAGALVPSGYTAAHTADYRNDSNDSNFQVSYKVMGATPDTSVSIPASNATTAGVAYVVYVFRGVDVTTGPDDATPVVAGGTNTGIANASGITPVTQGAWIAAFGGAAVAAGAVFTNPTNMSTVTNHFRTATITSTTNDANIGGSLYTAWTSGQFTPNAFGGSTTTNTGSWSAVTLALKPIPDPVTHDTSGTLTADIGSIAGTAQYNASHSTTGTLAGQEGVIVGSAARSSAFVDHATTGVLVGDIGSIAGSASSATTRPSSGALTGPGSTLAGSATQFRALSSTGVLQGQGSTLEGSAARVGAPVSHATTGDLSGTSSTLSGSSARVRVMSSSGSLTGAPSTLSGEAQRTGAPATHDTEGALQGQGSTLSGEASGPVQQRNAGFEMSSRKVYIKRGKRIHIFDTVEDADAWVEAEQQATQAIEKAKGKKKLKAKAKVYKALDEQLPHEVIRLDWLESLVAHFNIPVELPTLEAQQDWMEVARIALLAREMQDEEEVEMLLIA